MNRNQEQIDFWNGTAGDRWVEAQVVMDRSIEPLGRAAMEAARVGVGQRVLDVGSGCGDTALELAKRVGPTGHVTGVDVSAPMTARARERAAEAGVDVGFVIADASTAEFTSAFDLVYSRFGVMFFDDPVAAFRHIRGALAPGGRLAFVCWQPLALNPWARIPLEAVNSVLGPPASVPAPDGPGPFAFARPERIHEILGGAGFSNVSVVPLVESLLWSESTDEQSLRDRFVRIGPAARRLYDLRDDTRESAIAAVLQRIQPFVTPRGLAMDAAVWIVTAE